MKLIITFLLSCFVLNSNSQIITTFAGTGSVGYSGNGGPATSALLSNPQAICTDNAGNLYVGYSNSNLNIAKIKKYSSTGAWLMDIGGGYGDNELDGTGAQIYDYYENYASFKEIKIDNEGNIYAHTDRIKKYSSTGAWLMTLGDGVDNAG